MHSDVASPATSARRGRQLAPGVEPDQRPDTAPLSAVEPRVVLASLPQLRGLLNLGGFEQRANTLRGLHRTVGNQTTSRLLDLVQRNNRGRGTPAPGAAATQDPTARANALERRYRQMVAGGQRRGYPVAAANLAHWLDGHGAPRTMDAAWLRGYAPVRAAEATNHGRFENGVSGRRDKGLKAHAARLADGANETFTDHWDALIQATTFTELFYASGSSTLTSTGTFHLVRAGRTVRITGTVQHHWHDRYDWNAGQGAPVPGFGAVSDDDALFLRRMGRGQDYDLVGDWTTTATGSVDIGRVFNTISVTWSQ